ncbi:MAG: aldehyde dehydrogenase family protein, partial [Dehalococcoidia bacterium]
PYSGRPVGARFIAPSDGSDAPPATVLGPELVEIPAARAGTARTAQEEIFGPVLALIPFQNDAEVVRIANGTRYALTGGVFSRSPGTVARMAAELDAGNLYVNRPITGARVGVEPFGGHRMSGTGPKAGGEEYLWAFVTGRAGYRPGGPLPPGDAQLTEAALRPWIDVSARQRGEVVHDALSLLRRDWRGRWAGVGGGVDALAVVEALLGRLREVATPAPTVPLPGQQTETHWETPRGCGIVVVDDGAPPESLPSLTVAALLAGNGVVVLPDTDRRPLAEVLVAALHHAGVPRESLVLAPVGLDLAAAVGLPSVTFAAADVGIEQAHELYRLLGDASAAPEATHLKALISLADGPGPAQPSFLRRFALPKTVAVQTLHLGAELEMLERAGE